jgi:hypothetical protein
MLPRLFAVLDDNPEWRENFCRGRFCLLRRNSGPAEELGVEIYDVSGAEYVTLEKNFYSTNPVRVSIGGSESLWWHTGYSLCYHGVIRAPSPVVDFLHRSLLPIEYTITAMHDTDIGCMVRQVDQRCARSRIEDANLGMLVAVNESRPLPQLPQLPQMQLPKFVLEGYIRDAQAQGQTCPITCKTPSECSTISITNCYHWFETDALERWRSTKNTCPVCKGNLLETSILSKP